jgi:hypothetical protein
MLPTVIALIAGLTQPSQNLVGNPQFRDGLDGWTCSGAEASHVRDDETGRAAAQVTVGPDAAIGYPGLAQDVGVKPGDIVTGSFLGRGEGIRDGYGAYMALNFHRADGERISFRQTGAVVEGESWQSRQLYAVVPPETVRTELRLILNGRGTGFFTDVTLQVVDRIAEDDAEGPVTLKVTDETVCEGLIGFGFEDDGWFYNTENARHGADESDYAQREARIAWMEPDFVRMFFWYKDWNPGGDWTTFDFDSPNMKSKYRSLDLYQRLGAHVNVTGVEWGVHEPYVDPPRTAKAIGALLEHLVKVKGYTCIRYWTLTNEPDIGFLRGGSTFEKYVQIHQLVREEFERRGLKIQIVGSDEALGPPWFIQCVENAAYFETADLFASHRYFQIADRPLAGFFLDQRLGELQARQPAKPFIVTEFGFQDSRASHLLNPVMEEYPYAVWAARFAITGLNKGVSGFSVWCLHEVYYPGEGFMNYGLWDFKDNAWHARPVYHAWSMFTRLTRRGDTVRRVESTHPGSVSGARVGDTVFWVNDSETSREVRLEAFAASEVRIMSEATLAGDRDCGTVRAVTDPVFEAPPMSFGYAR